MQFSPFFDTLDTFAVNKQGDALFKGWLSDQLARLKSCCFDWGLRTIHADNTVIEVPAVSTNVPIMSFELPAKAFVRTNSTFVCAVFGEAIGHSGNSVTFQILDAAGTVLVSDLTQILHTGPGQITAYLFRAADTAKLMVQAQVVNQATMTVHDVDPAIFDAACTLRFVATTANGHINKYHSSITYRRAG